MTGMRATAGMVALVLALVGCAAGEVRETPLRSPAPVSGAQTPSTSPSPFPTTTSSTPTATPPETEVMVAVGDIASCAVETDDAVGAAVAAEQDAAVVATLGDHVYPSGTPETYRDCYAPAWGPVLDRTRPAVGNHDLEEDLGSAYWAMFGERAGEPGEGWYSYDLGAWHVVVLNSNCELIPCGPDSPQHDWLVADLEGSSAECTLAYWHHPVTSSGYHGRYPPVDPLWAAVTGADVDLALAGHDHYYERLGPLGPDASPHPDGTPLIIAGTGGVGLRPRGAVVPGSEMIIDDAFGYLRLSLAPDGYAFAFVTLDGAVRDSGEGSCR